MDAQKMFPKSMNDSSGSVFKTSSFHLSFYSKYKSGSSMALRNKSGH